MSIMFWIKRFLIVFACASSIIFAAQMIKGHRLAYSVMQGVVWGSIAAVIFTGARIFQSRNGQHCAICRDTPEMRRTNRNNDSDF